MPSITKRVPKPAPFVGSYINYEYYQYLTREYAQKHPIEHKSVFIAKDLILQALAQASNTSGLRFMYGLKAGVPSSSRTVILMPCNDTSMNKPLPNLLLSPEYYWANTGEKVTLDECWTLFSRHVQRMCSLMPDEQRKEMPRGCFYGINSLKDLLHRKDCAGIFYHFGYNPSTAYLPERYEAVLEPVNNDRKSFGIYMEEGQHCPTYCPPMFGVPIAAHGVIASAFSNPEDSALYEMYHHVSPSLIEAMQQAGIPEQIYQQQFSASLTLLEEGHTEEARRSFKLGLEELMTKYVIKN